MRGQAMKKICEKLEQQGFDMSQMDALEFFAREGDWHIRTYADKVGSLEAWELDCRFEEGLKKNLPFASVKIGNSFELARLKTSQNKFDYIVIDNPQYLYGTRNEYCEHFEALELVPLLMKNKAIVIFDINSKPFDYDKHIEWQQRRNKFYHVDDASVLSKSFLMVFYKEFFEGLGLNVDFSWIEPRNNEYLAYMIIGLCKSDCV